MKQYGVTFRADFTHGLLLALVRPVIIPEAMEAERQITQMRHAIIGERNRCQDAAFLRRMRTITNGALRWLFFWWRIHETCRESTTLLPKNTVLDRRFSSDVYSRWCAFRILGILFLFIKKCFCNARRADILRIPATVHQNSVCTASCIRRLVGPVCRVD